MVQSHILALAATAQKTELFGLVEQTHPIGSKLQTFFSYKLFSIPVQSSTSCGAQPGAVGNAPVAVITMS